MSRFLQLQQLLGEDSILEKLSFYPDYLLEVRSILSQWIEEQDWWGIAGSVDKAIRSEEAFQEALSLLQEKRQLAGFEFCILNTHKLKKAYQSDPVKFVEELQHCMEEEQQLLNDMLAEEQAMQCDSVSLSMSAQDLTARIDRCRQLDQRVMQVLKAAYMCLEKWREDIDNKSSTIRDVYGRGDTMLPPYTVFMGLKKELEQVSRDAMEQVNCVLAGLQGFIRRWKTWQLHECVSRRVDGEDPQAIRQVEGMCEQVCGSVYSLMKCVGSLQMQEVFSVQQPKPQPPSTPVYPCPSTVSSLSMALKDILKKIVEKFLVVKKQPPLTMMIEKEKGQKDKEDINNSKKFTTTVGLLGGKGFENGISINEMDIYLAFSQDLAVAQQRNLPPRDHFKIHHEGSDARTQSSACHLADTPLLPYERTYEKLRVEQFSRRDTKHVYKQLYNVVYDIKLSFPLFMQEFNTQAISLPIIVRTGANQASEHIGAQLWHSFSSPNVYNLQTEMAPSLAVGQIIQMMDERIKFIGGQGLRAHEKDFLRERLYMAIGAKGPSSKHSTDAMVTLDNFIKDKVMLPRHGSAEKDTMDFSLWRWLHSIINLLDDPENLKQPWIDGIIYGFGSRQQCISALEGSENGSFLLRFSESVLIGNHTMAKGGLAAVIHRNGQVDFAPPISSDGIEKDGLGNMIASIGCRYLLGTNLTIDTLCEKYPPKKQQGNSTGDRYQGWRKQEIFVPTEGRFGAGSQVNSPNPHVAAPAQRERKKPKRARQRVVAGAGSKQSRMEGPGSPDSYLSTASMTSSGAMSPDAHFQPVGVQELQPQPPLAGYEATAAIPTTVYPYMMEPNGQDQTLMTTTAPTSHPQTMILHMPEHQMTQLLTDCVHELDISEHQMLSADDQNAAFAFSQNPAMVSTTFLVGPNDPNLQGVMASLASNGQQPTLSIEEVDECLNMNI
ncbi:hypothetical protein ACOMHN_004573 [Nucella lapillus]